MKRKVILFITIVLLISLSFTQKETKKELVDYKFKKFVFQEKMAIVMFPNKANDKKQWIWRARFWGTEPQVDIALLEKGFHLVYIDVSGMYGNSEAVDIWCDFYSFVQKKYDLNTKVTLECMSRGGLIAYNWASQNTDKVACIYADAPVCDIKSWPGGLGVGLGSYLDWKYCLRRYGLTEQSVLGFEKMPVNNCVNVAKANIPVIHVCGDSDEHVPYEENSKIIKEKFDKIGTKFKLVLKKEGKHHPHSLKNPKPIVDFILENY